LTGVVIEEEKGNRGSMLRYERNREEVSQKFDCRILVICFEEEKLSRTKILYRFWLKSLKMEVIQISKEELEELIERKIREALLKVFMEFTPYVSDEEQEEIEKIAGNPEDYDESEFETWDGQ